MSGAPPEELLWLVIRFTTALPDLPLTIESPRTTPTLALKALIRPHLNPDLANNRLRLIYAGKVLEDNSPLSQSLLLNNRHAPSTPPPPPKSSISKGKQPLRDGENKKHESCTPSKLYIHCSIGDALSPEALAQEHISAQLATEKLQRKLLPQSRRESTTSQSSLLPHNVRTAEGPRGFDRLLTTGFTQAEVLSLRQTFLSHLSLTHTPDTMPNGAALLALEDRWLDSSGPDAANLEGGGFDDDESSSLDDMFWGNLMGFFWPLGALVWGIREEGVWTRRRVLAVATGVLVNLVFGFARLSSVRDV